MTRRILVITPHADDEVVGCGGMIARAATEGAAITLAVMAMGGIRHYHLPQAATSEARSAELEKAAATLGIQETKVLFPGKDMRLESVPMLELVSTLDGVLGEKDYDECYFPEPSHNLDHRRTHDAVVGALRPAGRSPLKVVATYEGPASAIRPQTTTAGWLYVDISATLDVKIAALHAYRSQLREFPHPMSVEAMRRLVAIRGLECGLEAAERYQVHRIIRA